MPSALLPRICLYLSENIRPVLQRAECEELSFRLSWFLREPVSLGLASQMQETLAKNCPSIFSRYVIRVLPHHWLNYSCHLWHYGWQQNIFVAEQQQQKKKQKHSLPNKNRANIIASVCNQSFNTQKSVWPTYFVLPTCLLFSYPPKYPCGKLFLVLW